MKIFIHLLLFVLFLLTIESRYEVILDRSEQTDDGSNWDIGTGRVRKFNRSTAVVTGVFTLKTSIDNSYELTLEAFNLSGGQYKKIFGRKIGNVCDVTYDKAYENSIRKFIASTNISSVYGDCPVPPQTVHINDYSTSTFGDILPEYIPGNERWKVIATVSKNNKIFAQLTTFAILRDNQKLFDSKW